VLARKIAYNTFAQIGGKLLGFVISSVLLVIISDRLGTTGIGAYVTVLAFVNFFVNAADLGANLVMVRDVAQKDDEKERVTGEFLGFRLTFSLIIMAMAPFVAMLIPQYNSLIVWGVAIASAGQFVLLVNQLFVSVLQVRLKMDKASLAELINRLVTLAGAIVLTRLAFTQHKFFFGLFFVTLIGSLVNAYISYYYAQKEWRIRPHFSLPKLKSTLVIILPMGIFSFLSLVHFKADTIILSLVKSQQDVGIYGYAYKIGEIIFTFPVMFVGTVFPKLSEVLAQDKEKFYKLCQSVLNALIIGSIPFLLLIFMMAPELTLILARKEVADGLLAGISLRILTGAFVFWFIGTLFIHIMIAASAYGNLIRNLGWAVVVNIGLNLVLIPRYSYYGAASVTLITEFIMFFLTLSVMRKTVGFKPVFGLVWPVGAASAVMGLIIWQIIRLPLFSVDSYIALSRITQVGLILGIGLLGAAIYGAILFVLKRDQLLAAVKGMNL
jgi:O-antigen/teichoic acid export membrane protein